MDTQTQFLAAAQLHIKGELARAEEEYRRVLLLDDGHADALNNLGILCMESERIAEAVSLYRRALKRRPNYPQALNNLGNALKAENHLAEAIEVYAEGIRQRPDYDDLLYNDALAHLKMGNMPECWLKFESRWQSPYQKNMVRHFPQPRYWGEAPLTGKAILVHAEQGMGDAIQMARYVRLLKEAGAVKVYLEVQPVLKQLLKNGLDADGVYAVGETLPPFDVYCPLMSLPLAFGTTENNLPRDVPYIKVRAEMVAQIATEMGPKRSLRIGVCWKGNPGFRHDNERSPGLAPFRKLLALKGVEFVNLVPGSRSEFLEATPYSAKDLGRDLVPTADGYEETAALVANLDLVITSDTSVCHLAGALGKPVWIVLAKYAADWRWLLDREDSPWYPTARLFRQTERGDWDGVMDRVLSQLSEASMIADTIGKSDNSILENK